jgi:adenine-specific DNA-methyltransferase
MREHKQLASPLLNHAEVLPHELAPRLTLKRKSALGQFMTPASLARFMASLFSDSTLQTCHLLDAGAGIGALSAAFLERWALKDGLGFQSVELEAYEIDQTLRTHLETTLEKLAARLPLTFRVLSGDFIAEAASQSLPLLALGSTRFTHAILNPPYKKINSASEHRLLLAA